MDGDGDGMDDTWELLHWLNDADSSDYNDDDDGDDEDDEDGQHSRRSMMKWRTKTGFGMVTFAIAVLAFVGVLAGGVPARRLGRVPPTEASRTGSSSSPGR